MNCYCLEYVVFINLKEDCVGGEKVIVCFGILWYKKKIDNL